MNEALHITERNDVILNILNSIQFQGYHEITTISPNVAKAMQLIAEISRDIQKYEAEQKQDDPPKEEDA